MAVSVADLLASGRLERIAPDRAAGLVRIAKAEQHLATSQMLLGHDNEMAYAALYDAARKAATAHMLARGYSCVNQQAGSARRGWHLLGRGGAGPQWQCRKVPANEVQTQRH